ncbi:GGDEF-domain containing protein [Rhizobium rhizosphaerae]|uniref:GGDEF-domain containing protein n=1 Tax=Xaviernesmea rhizosphaerae TaxID=1672749 RepID=A0ABX3PGG2_9HYPH|nr:EAL domain-containing protein [Xaviernesmea rhizosphaerae]OQP87226.1 GGDEF-domain containing protein [Xaviernesmea rhizosphaerae]
MARLFTVASDNPELLKAQYQAFTRQMPMMYFILLSSTWALAVTHMRSTPLWLAIGVPAVLTLICAKRLMFWRRVRFQEPSAEQALRVLQGTNRLAVGIAVAFTTWSFLLVPYGDAYARSHVAFYMAITVISCIFCLMHVRSAALIVTLIVNGAFVTFFLAMGHLTFAAVTINVALVCYGMLSILFTNYRNFEQMIVSQQRTRALGDENLRLANIDRLTDLPNRRAFFSHLEQALDGARQDGTRLALTLLDLDGFKPVNDVYGHSAGDRLLMEIGQRLMTLPEGCKAFRLGGDEFAIVTVRAAEDGRLVEQAMAVAEIIQQPVALAKATAKVAASLGIAVYPDLASTCEQLFDRADYALYHAKRMRRGSAVLFSTAHERTINAEARIEQALKQADLASELSIVFQPIVDIVHGTVEGFETLARWDSPVLGRVPPAQFIPVAERTSFVSHLTRALLQKSLAVAATWPDSVCLAFNLSAQDLASPDGVTTLIAIIENSGVPANRIDFEITETALTYDFDQVKQSVERLRALGCRISLDDFGVGYSSLTRLHALPLTRVKIDRSFVSGLHQRPASYKIVKSVLALSRDMGLECVVEGVETCEELAVLQQLQATLVQGHLYARPMDAEEIPAFLADFARQRLAV